MNVLLIFLLYALNGTTFTVSKILVGHSSPIFIVGIRMIIAGLALLGYYRFVLGKKIKVPRKAIIYLVQSTLCNIFIPYCLRYWALQYVTATKTSFFYNLLPFITHTLACLIGIEKGSWKKTTALFIGCLGIIPILLSNPCTEDVLGCFYFVSLPELALLGTVTAFAYSWIVIQKIVKTYRVSPFLLNGINMFCGGVLAMIVSLIFETNHTISAPIEFAWWLLIIIIITNFICYNLYAVLLKNFSTTLISFASLTMPFFAALSGWAYFGESVSWHNFISSAMTLIGLYIFYKAEKKQDAYAIEA